MVGTSHVARMLDEAARLARLCDGENGDALVDPGDGYRPLPVIVVLERVTNLARHAAAEAEDEQLRAAWPFPFT